MLRKTILPLLIVALFATVGVISAQDEDTLSLLDAYQLVKDSYGDDVVIAEISYDEDFSCWEVEFADGSEICLDDTSGELIDPSSDDSVDDSDDDSSDDSDDDSSDDSDDDSSDDSDEVDDSDEDSETQTPEITLEEAIEAALKIFPDSTVSSAELEQYDNGRLVWDIELDNDQRNVDVDANTGEVISFGYEDNDDNSSVGSTSQDDNSDDSNDDDSNHGSDDSNYDDDDDDHDDDDDDEDDEDDDDDDDEDD